jgi:hypothetical protein
VGWLGRETGSGVVAQYFTHGVNADGSRWTQVRTGSPSSAMWERTTVDMLGRTVLVERIGTISQHACSVRLDKSCHNTPVCEPSPAPPCE